MSMSINRNKWSLDEDLVLKKHMDAASSVYQGAKTAALELHRTRGACAVRCYTKELKQIVKPNMWKPAEIKILESCIKASDNVYAGAKLASTKLPGRSIDACVKRYIKINSTILAKPIKPTKLASSIAIPKDNAIPSVSNNIISIILEGKHKVELRNGQLVIISI